VDALKSMVPMGDQYATKAVKDFMGNDCQRGD
jgi:hypothetical protein